MNTFLIGFRTLVIILFCNLLTGFTSVVALAQSNGTSVTPVKTVPLPLLPGTTGTAGNTQQYNGPQPAQIDPAASTSTTPTGNTSGTAPGTPQASTPTKPATPGDKSKDEADADCEDTATAAQAACNPAGFAGMDQSTGAAMEMAASQATNIMGQMQQQQAAAANPTNPAAQAADQCQHSADLSKLLGMLNAAKGAACGAAMYECNRTCDRDAKELEKIAKASRTPDQAMKLTWDTKRLSVCKSYQTNMLAGLMTAMQMGQNFLQNKACAAAASVAAQAAPFALPTTPQVVLPTQSGCSDPNVMASSVACQCDPTNPSAATNPLCANTNPNGGNSPTSVNVGSNGPGGVPRAGSTAFGTAGTPPSTDMPTPKTQSGTNVPQNSGGGGGGFGAASNGAPPGAAAGEDGAGAASNVDKNVIGGQGSGGGGGLAGPPGSGSGNGNGGSGKGSFFDKFNLSKFLPNKKNYANRGLAGMSVQSKDGITGPMGPSLWEKVSNQYQHQKAQLINDR